MPTPTGSASSCTARCCRQHALTCRTFIAFGVDAQAPLDQIDAAIRAAAASPLHQHNDMLWLRGIKVVPRRRHADRQRVHARALGCQQDLFDRRSALPRRAIHRAREAVSHCEARTRKRSAVHRALARRRRRRRDGRNLRPHQPRRLSGARQAAEHHPRQLHERRSDCEDEGAWRGRQHAAGLALSRRRHAATALRPRTSHLLPSLSRPSSNRA